MSDIDILRELFREDVKITPVESGIELLEPKCPDSKLTVKNLPTGSMVIKLDSFAAPDSFFAGSKHECRRADYALISELAGRVRIIILEIKRKSGDNSSITDQLAGGRCVMEYCKAIGRAFWAEQSFLSDFDCRFVAALRTGSVRKRTSKPKERPDKPDSPEKFYKVFGSSIEYNEIAW